MTRVAILLGWMAGAWSGAASTAPIYINNSPVQSPPAVAPQIDATAFVNRSLFSVSLGGGLQSLPYETLSTLFFTNTSSGQMIGDPGFRFTFSTNNNRLMMDTWVNQGRITTDSQNFFFFTGDTANWLLVEATNIVSSGPMSVGSQGLLRLQGKNINLRRNGIRSGTALTNNGFFFGSTVLENLYVNDVGITDAYWGTGTNNALGAGGPTMSLTGFGGNALSYQLPFPQSPNHQVLENFSGFIFTNTVSVPFFFSGGYAAEVFTNQLGPTNFNVQVVFYPTNNFDTNFSTSVRFYGGFGANRAIATVGFHSKDFDIVSQQDYTNSLYLVDALPYSTNLVFARNFDVNTRRPISYEVTRNEPFYSSFGTPGNGVYTNTLLYNPATSVTNEVPVNYTGYSVQVTPFNNPAFNPFGPIVNTSRNDPTNYPGRVEIIGENVDLDKTRIRADSTFVLRAESLTSNRMASVDAPFIIFDVGSTESSLVISNLAPASVRRLNGSISAWSATWRNFEFDPTSTNATTTNLLVNAVDYHVLIVENNLSSFVPVTVNEFKVRGHHVVLADSVQVGRLFNLDMAGLELTESLLLPAGAGWGDTNVHSLLNFTNRGTLQMDGSAMFGEDRPEPYDNFVNSGSISAASEFVRARNFDNSGVLTSRGGLLSVKALNAQVLGQPTLVFTNIFTNIFFGFTNIFTNIVTNSIGATLAGSSDIQLDVESLVISNSIIRAGLGAPGALFLNATNRLQDAGLAALNVWEVTAGFTVPLLPAVADLQGTSLRSTVDPFAEVVHVWGAEDRGTDPVGFNNNMALGRLILDAQGSLSLLRFRGPGVGPRAFYVDYLEFQNYATNVINALTIDSDLTLYFADSNLSAEKLDGSFGGRLRWVPFYAGPNSSTNLIYASGQVVTLNRALVTSKDRDDDNDGIVNAEDPEPVLVPILRLSLEETPVRRAVLQWDSVAFHTSHVLMKTSQMEVLWRNITSIVNGPVNATLTYEDPLPEGTPQRFYQIRMELP